MSRVGTPSYIAPEVLQHEGCDPLSTLAPNYKVMLLDFPGQTTVGHLCIHSKLVLTH